MEAIELINILWPDHDRKSCSDDNISNGFYTHDELGRGRCVRCMLLQLENGEKPENFNSEWIL